ncbi:single-stranded DNA-binding protein, mitochondrial-like [Littorina saxatilis]|uniref:Single-stranded DNA-binding protein, mitochondrial n=1 Tax=Littorina saxatilis TaxID=31220 RepID=A0AAN9B4M4_9CAEN
MLRLFSRTGLRAVQQLQASGKRPMAIMANNDDANEPAKYEKCVNQVNLLGRLGRDAEMRGSQDHPVCVFSMATNSVFTKADGSTTARVDWHRISVFKPGLREKVAAHLRKGDRVFVTGVIRYDEYTDAQENLVRATTILANDLVNLTKRYLGEEEGTETVSRGF